MDIGLDRAVSVATDLEKLLQHGNGIISHLFARTSLVDGSFDYSEHIYAKRNGCFSDSAHISSSLGFGL